MELIQELDARVADLQQQLAEAQAAATAERTRVRDTIVDQINGLIAQHGIASHELTFASSTPGNRTQSAKRPKGPVGKAKYRNPATGATWTGHGKAPGWIPLNKEERKSFLIVEAA